MHLAITAASTYSPTMEKTGSSSDFEFSARFGSSGCGGSGWMSSADELFLNGQIRPMKLSRHLQRAQVLAPLVDLEEEEGEEENDGVRGRDVRPGRRRTRSLSPLRNKWSEHDDKKEHVTPDAEASGSGSGRKRWVFLRDFLRSKSEGRSNNKFWSSISFSPATKDKKAQTQTHPCGPQKPKKTAGKPRNGVAKRPSASAHELHYKAHRAQAEELRRKTFLPYRQGLLGCLGFSSKGYGAITAFARALNPVSSR
ncbi:hypothetical protein Fmac_006908 [Flemingia macrophylla]|uniref:Uncharacterized protein n=1 Tax=Flemingia macrophylla TaxID=520843 RepID=A0ABD1NCH1_9FABA